MLNRHSKFFWFTRYDDDDDHWKNSLRLSVFIQHFSQSVWFSSIDCLCFRTKLWANDRCATKGNQTIFDSHIDSHFGYDGCGLLNRTVKIRSSWKWCRSVLTMKFKCQCKKNGWIGRSFELQGHFSTIFYLKLSEICDSVMKTVSFTYLKILKNVGEKASFVTESNLLMNHLKIIFKTSQSGMMRNLKMSSLHHRWNDALSVVCARCCITNQRKQYERTTTTIKIKIRKSCNLLNEKAESRSLRAKTTINASCVLIVRSVRGPHCNVKNI